MSGTRLIVVSGLPGTGKSAAAERLADALLAAHVPIDVVEEAPANDWSRLEEDRHPYAGGPGHDAAYLENTERFTVELVASTKWLVGG